MDDIIESIQRDILDPSVPLDTILLKAKVLAHQLKNERFKQWVKSELDGYDGEEDVPDYRVIKPQSFAQFVAGRFTASNIPIGFSKTSKEFQEYASTVKFGGGVHTLAEIARAGKSISFDWPPQWLAYWSSAHAAELGFQQLVTVRRPVPPEIFAQMATTVRSRLQDFILELSDTPWNMGRGAVPPEQIERLVAGNIYHNEGAIMTVFDQRDQQVQSQNNAAHDVIISGGISLGAMQNQPDFIQGLQKFKTELAQASQDGVIDAEVATDADFEVASAIQQAKKAQPDKVTIVTHLENVKELTTGVAAGTSLISGIDKLLDAAQMLFSS